LGPYDVSKADLGDYIELSRAFIRTIEQFISLNTNKNYMKMKKIFTKTLLLAAMLAAGVSSAWD
jgi:hypothetical protein